MQDLHFWAMPMQTIWFYILHMVIPMYSTQSPWMMPVAYVDQSQLVFHAQIQESFATSINFIQTITSSYWYYSTASRFGIEITHYSHCVACWYLFQRF